MKQHRFIIVLSGLLLLICSCGKNESRVKSTSAAQTNDAHIAASRKEIIAPNVLAVQLAAHHELETRMTFAPTELIPASLYLMAAPYSEPRRVAAFLTNEKVVVEEQSIEVSADDKREVFDFRFSKMPRPVGNYRIEFVEIARSNGKPMLLARLFLIVE